jgi:hypothetical protein
MNDTTRQLPPDLEGMNDQRENPQAFPENTFQKCGDVAVGECKPGMTLRDYFAAAALQGLAVLKVATEHHTGGAYGIPIIPLAECAYEIADAMLKARQS